MLTFDAESHVYQLDGEVVPSVTQLLKPLVDYSAVPPDVLERARVYGVAVHKMIALEIAGTLDYGTLDDGLFPALQAFGKWRKDHPSIAAALPTALVETPLAHKRLGYAGTPDIIPECMVIDIKTREMNSLADPLQCAAYEELHKANGGAKGKYEHWILRIIPDGTYKFQKVNHREAWSRFRLLLDHYNNYKTIESWR